MGLFQRVRDIGIKFTYYVGGRAFDPSKQKRTTAFEDIKRRKYESNTGVDKEVDNNVQEKRRR